MQPSISKAFYVSLQGNDSNPGIESQPWRTLQHAANSVKAGNTVIVSAGIYDDGRATVRASGTADSPICFRAQGTVEIPGFNLTGDFLQVSGFTVRFFESTLSDESFYGIEIRGNHFIIEDNRFIETLDAGVFTSPQSANGLIRRNFFYRNVLVSIEVHGARHLIEANTIRQPIQDHPSGQKTDDADAIRFFGTGHTFRGNDIREIWYGANVRDAHMDCFQTFRGTEDGDPDLTTDILIEDNYCEASSYQTEDECSSGVTLERVGSADGTFERGIIIRNNLIIAPYASGIHGTASFVSFVNNTCICHPDFTQYNTYALDYWHPDCRRLNIQNNLFYNYTHPFYISNPAWDGSILSGNFPPPVIHFYSHVEQANLTDIGMTTPKADSTLGADMTRVFSAPQLDSVFSNIPAAPTISPAPISPWVKRIYFANFENTLAGWLTAGNVTLSQSKPKVDKQAVLLQGNSRLEMDTLKVFTIRHAEIIVRVLMGADKLEADETFQIFWRAAPDITEWQLLPENFTTDGQLYELIFSLPPAAAEQSQFQIAFSFRAAQHKTAYLDNLEILGIPKYRKRHKTFVPFLTG